MNNKHKKTSMALLLSFVVGFALPMNVYANSGGIFNDAGVPNNNGKNYSGSKNGAVINTNGQVVIDSFVTNDAHGGWDGGNNTVSDNEITMSDGGDVNGLYGGKTETGVAKNNTVNINGGKARGNIDGGRSLSGESFNNTINITGGTLLGGVYAGSTNAVSRNNAINVTNTTMKTSNDIIAGYSHQNSAVDNTTKITGSTIENAQISGAYAKTEANNNSVNITGGSFRNTKIIAGDAGVNANSNIVTIDGGNFTQTSIIAGRATNVANNNTLIVKGAATFDNTVEIFGGQAQDAFTGNTLDWGVKSTISIVGNFENYNFTIPDGAQPNEILLKINGPDATDLNNSKVKLVAVQGNRQWQNGESVTLMNNENGINGNYQLINGKTASGLRLYDYILSKDANNIFATIGNVGPKPNPAKHSKSLSEGRMAALGFINTAADMVAGSGLQNAMDSSSEKYDIFGSMNYSDTKLKTDGDTDVKGTSMLIGASRKLATKGGHMVLGAFFESGWSTYNTAENFEHVGTVSANGKSNYFGGGLLARNIRDNGLYVEGSLRVGRMSTDYNSYDIGSKYDIKSTYYGLHVGIGKVLKLNNSNDIDVYGKYFWSHQNSASAMIKGDKINFDSINSNRLRIGARLNMVGGGNGIKTYVGLAYEHEFSGSVGATALGGSIASPSIKGGTGIGEIGMVYKPSGKSAFSMDVGLNGFVGKRQGIGGGVKLNWGF